MSKSSVEVILLHDFRKKGKLGDIIAVKLGYAKNFLIPSKFAIYASKVNRAKLDVLKAVALENSNKMRDIALQIVEKLKLITIAVVRNSAQDNKIFGTVSPKDIANELVKKDILVERNQIVIPSLIKYLGVHKVKFVLHPDVIFEKELYIVNSTGGISMIKNSEDDMEEESSSAEEQRLPSGPDEDIDFED